MMVVFRGFRFWIILAGGQWISFHPLPNEDGGLRLWYRDWSSRRTCNFQFSVYRPWLPAKPRTGMSFSVASGPSSELLCQQVSIHCTVFAIWIFAVFVRWNSCFLQGQRKKSSLLVFLPCHPTLACQTLGGCLCTPDALHNSNSVRYFWASVSFLLFTSSWQEPFGESLSRLTIDSKTMSEFTLLN